MEPGLEVHTATSAATLLDLLASKLARCEGEPFATTTVVVPARSTGRRIRLGLADRLGVAASLALPLPSEIAQGILEGAEDKVPMHGADPVLWASYRILAEPGVRRLGPLARYLDDDVEDRKRVQLARRLAEHGRELAVWRPDWLRAWTRGASMFEASQPKLVHTEQWLAGFFARLFEVLGGPIPTLLDAIDSLAGPRPGGIPNSLWWFVGPEQPPLAHELMAAIGRHVSVQAFALVPSPLDYWADFATAEQNQTGTNRLFANNGKVAGALGALLQDLEEDGRARVHEPMHSPPSVTANGADAPRQLDLFAPPNQPNRAGTRLSVIQEDARQLVDRSTVPQAPWPKDATITLHGCHGPLRELEVLHDRILSAMAADATLRPDDILVLLPDIGTYAPWIDAVFSSRTVNSGARAWTLPYTIAAPATVDSRPLLRAFCDILALVDSRFGVRDVLQIMEREPVLTRFGLTPADLPTIRDLVERAHVHWGIDAAHKKTRFDVPPEPMSTWRMGLDRLLLGFATGASSENDDTPALRSLARPLLPSADETTGRAEVLGALVECVEALATATRRLQSARDAAGWADALQDVANLCLAGDRGAHSQDQVILRSILATLREEAAKVLDGTVVPFAAMHAWLLTAMQSRLPTSPGLTGGIRFALLARDQISPCRILALVGMHHDAFPRGTEPTSFDLRGAAPRDGDVEPRTADRGLFLDSLLTPSDAWMVTWRGRDPHTNQTQQPSVCVTELMEQLHRTFAIPGGEALVTEHPLQPFSPRYFAQSDQTGQTQAMPSFSAADRAGAQALFRRNKPPAFSPWVTTASVRKRIQTDRPPQDRPEVSFQDLLEFWENPVRQALYIAGIRRVNTRDALSNDESFSLDGLERYQLGEELLRVQRLGDGSPALHAQTEQLAQRGLVPPSAFAAPTLYDAAMESRSLLGSLGEAATIPAVPRAIALDRPRYLLRGVMEHVSTAGYAHARAASLKGKNQLATALHHAVLLGMRATEHAQWRDVDPVSRFVASKDVMELCGTDFKAALTALDVLVEAFVLIQESWSPTAPTEIPRALLPFPTNTVVTHAVRPPKPGKGTFDSKTLRAWAEPAGEFSSGGESEDAHVRLAFQHLNAPNELDQWVEEWAAPIRDLMTAVQGSTS